MLGRRLIFAKDLMIGLFYLILVGFEWQCYDVSSILVPFDVFDKVFFALRFFFGRMRFGWYFFETPEFGNVFFQVHQMTALTWRDAVDVLPDYLADVFFGG